MGRTDDLWLEWHVGLRDHPKTARLRRRLSIGLAAAVGHVSLMWGWAVRYAPNGDLSRYDADVIADAAGWDDEPGVFLRALVAAGFLNDDMTIHDWHAYVGRLIDRRAANARRMKIARNGADSARAGATGHNRTGHNRTGHNHHYPPTPSASGGGAEESRAAEPWRCQG